MHFNKKLEQKANELTGEFKRWDAAEGIKNQEITKKSIEMYVAPDNESPYAQTFAT
jgi:hypothetical protein